MWRRRAFQGLKTSSEKIGRNVHAHSFRFPRTKFFLPASQKALIRTWYEEIGRVDDMSSVSPDMSDFFVRETRITPRTRKSVRVGTA